MAHVISATSVILTCQQMRDIVTGLEEVQRAETVEEAREKAGRLLGHLTLEGILKRLTHDYGDYAQGRLLVGATKAGGGDE